MMNREWLSTWIEEALEPELEIVDPHHHMWDTVTVYGRYELEDLRLDTDAGHNVTETVFIDCGANYRSDGPEHMKPIGETEYIAGRADESDRTPGARIAAIVSRADLTLGSSVSEVLEAHVAAAGGRFRGIRQAAARADDPEVPVARIEAPHGLYTQADFQDGARTLAAMGLTFEGWQYHFQLGDVAALARAVPELPIVVNHVGGPLGIGRFADRQEEVLAETRTGLAELATLDNIYLKVGGIGMTRYGVGWENDDVAPSSDQIVHRWGDLLRFCIDTFGPARCMFESNYPVDGESCGYTVLWNAFKKVSADYSASERADLFSGTARRFYKL